MPATRLPAETHRADEAGFSMVDVLVSTGLLMISSVALMSVFNSSITSLKSISGRDAVIAAINADLAKIERLNDYYTCKTGSCSVLSLDQEPPDKFQYAPRRDDTTAFTIFAALCKNTPTNLSTALLNTIGASTTIIAKGAVGEVNINRTARLYPGNGSDSHLYIVEWSPPQGAKTQVTLSPPVGRWCP